MYDPSKEPWVSDWNEKQSNRSTILYFTANYFVEERRNFFYLIPHSTHFILWLCGIRHKVKDHSAREETHCHHYMISRDRIAHTTAFVYTSHGALAGMRNSSMLSIMWD